MACSIILRYKYRGQNDNYANIELTLNRKGKFSTGSLTQPTKFEI